jgi:uncharacterized lipoprotein YajG
MKQLFALVLLAMLAGCVTIPEDQLKPPKVLEQQNITETPVAEPVALPAAPVPNVTLPPAQNTSLAPLPKVSQVIHQTVQQNSSPSQSWSTEPLQIEEGQTMHIVVQKTK